MEPRPGLPILTPILRAARRLGPAALAAAGLALLPHAATARVLLTQKAALELAFPPGFQVERRTAYLSEGQARQAEQLARAKISSRVWTYYVGRSSHGITGYAYFETHTVRTMPETFMAVVDARGTLRFVELLAFYEPPDYAPPKRWLAQFRDRPPSDDLFVRRAIRNIAGASLTSMTLTEGIRRVLAIHAVLHPPPDAVGVANKKVGK